MMYKHQYKKEENRIKDAWRTPPEIFGVLDKVFDFTLDAAATPKNALCDKYYTEEDNGLAQIWRDETVFCNPPYTEGQYREWLSHAAEQYRLIRTVSALLVPNSIETRGFDPAWENARYFIFPYTRLAFLKPDGSSAGGAPFSSVIALFCDFLGKPDLLELTKIGRVLPLRELGLNNQRR